VEWRRVLWDDFNQKPSDKYALFRLMGKVGLDQLEAVEEDGTVEVSLQGTPYGGSLTFYATGKSPGKIIITQSNLKKKEQLWNLLAPHTHVCAERPSKRKR
jgi:hypothetical protein